MLSFPSRSVAVVAMDDSTENVTTAHWPSALITRSGDRSLLFDALMWTDRQVSFSGCLLIPNEQHGQQENTALRIHAPVKKCRQWAAEQGSPEGDLPEALPLSEFSSVGSYDAIAAW